jgi:MSHA biogenesis protein MshQ
MRQGFQVGIRFMAALLLLAFSLAGWAQTYSYRGDTFSYDTPSASAGTVTWHTTNASACSGYPNGDDDYADVNISTSTSPANDFTFTFAGVARTSVRIYSNGMLTFGTDNSGLWRDYTNSALPAPAVGAYSGSCPGGTASNVIIPYWTDIVAGTANNTSGASVRYELLGTKPDRRFVISWVNVKLYNQAARYNFQVILYETPTAGGNSNFKFQYTSGSSTGAAATVGVQVSSTDYTQYSYNQPYIDPTVGTAILWYPSTQFTGKQAEYRFDEGIWNGTAGEVKDTSTATYNAVRVGAAASSSTGKVCRGGSFPLNSSNATVSAVATPISPSSQGAIDFWYQSNVRWNAAGSDAMLFDATTTAARPFYLMKTAGGVLKFMVTDSGGTTIPLVTSAQSFNASTWQHVGVTWSINPGSNQTVLKIFLNGVQAAAYRGTSAAGAITALSSVYIGDNRTLGITPSGGTGNSANGYIDEVNSYNKEINAAQAANDMAATRTSCTSIDHFHISHAGSVVNCDTANITFEAHDVAHNQIALSGTTVTVSTSSGHGSWAKITGNGAVTNTGGGSATYTFSNEALIVLGLRNTYAETANIDIAAGTFTERSGSAATCVAADYTSGTTCDADLVFTQAGFRFVDASGNFVGNQIAGNVSGTYYLQAVQNTCTAQGVCSGVCSSIFPSGSAVDIGMAFECSDPSTCQSGQTLTVSPGSGAGSAGTIAGNGAGAVTATSGTYTTKALTFNAVSPNPLPAVPFTFNYTDVGQIRLWARYPASSVTPSVAGSSTSFVVKPAGFVLTEIKPTANQAGRCAVATTPAPTVICSSAATDSALFAKAGEAFSVTVTAVNGAGNATPNYGKESSAETVKLTPTNVLGTMNSAPAVNGSFGSFSGGQATGTAFSWDEVGIIMLTPSVGDADYLGAGDVTGTISGNVGRFIPDHIDAVVTDGCTTGAYTYSGQPIGLALSARNLAGNVTTNYNATTALSRTVTLAPSPASGTFDPATVNGSAFSVGTASATPKFNFTTLSTAPTTITVGGQDADGVALRASTDAGTKQTTAVRSGRLYLANAYGSEFLPLPMIVQTQYWDSGWKLNRLDSCTSLTVPTSVNGGLTNTLATKTTATLAAPVVSGDAVFRLSAPGAGNVGLADIIGSSVRGANSWLLLSTPFARACFGACGPRSPVIYFRERF